MKPELIIWDWNGTVLDDVEPSRLIANRMLKERGLRPFRDLTEYRAVFGFPIKEYYAKCGYTYETESYEQVADEFVILYREAFKTCPLRSGVPEAIAALQNKGLRQVLLSATKQSQLLDQVACFPELKPFFSDILGIRDHYAFSKAQLAADFIALCGLRPEQTVFIGDTDHDYEVSSAVGAPCVLMTGGHQSRERLESTGAVAVLDSFGELVRFLTER